MARPSGNWLAYLRFDCRGTVRVLHLLCDTRPHLDEVFSLLKGLPQDGGVVLVEYIVFHSQRNVYIREAPNFPERHVMTYASFMGAWGNTTDAPTAGTSSGARSAHLRRVLDELDPESNPRAIT